MNLEIVLGALLSNEPIRIGIEFLQKHFDCLARKFLYLRQLSFPLPPYCLPEILQFIQYIEIIKFSWTHLPLHVLRKYLKNVQAMFVFRYRIGL